MKRKTGARKIRRSHRKPTVYVWKSKDEYLYIGSSVTPIDRVCNHEVIDRVREVGKDDVIILIPCDDRKSMHAIEKYMIFVFKPKYNREWQSITKERILNAIKNGQKIKNA